MPKPSAFMVRLQENQRHNMHLQRLFTIQQCEDMALITLNEDFGFGESRAREFLARFRETFKAYADLCIADAKDDKDLAVTNEGSWDKPAKKYCEDCGAKMDGGAGNAGEEV